MKRNNGFAIQSPVTVIVIGQIDMCGPTCSHAEHDMRAMRAHVNAFDEMVSVVRIVRLYGGVEDVEGL